MMHKLISYYGFSRMPFGRDLAPGMLHRHSAHNEAVARIGWCIADRRIGVITGEVGAGKTVAVRAALASLDRSRHTKSHPHSRAGQNVWPWTKCELLAQPRRQQRGHRDNR